MASRRVSALIISLTLVAVACGDDDAGTTTTGAATATTGSAVTTTTPPEAGPLAPFEGIAVEDPCFDSGFQMFEPYEDRVDELRVVVDAGTVMLRPLQEAPAMSGLGEERVVLATACGDPGDIVLGFVMYTLAGSAWEATVAVQEPDLIAVLDGTTDFAAAGLTDPITLVPTLVSFDWAGSAAFVVDVEAVGGGGSTYSGQLGCTHDGTTLECSVLSDDGVLRPGDEGEDVEALQQNLEELGYFNASIDGKYGPVTRAAVRAFQRDFWLTRDGKAGPETLTLIDDLISGDSDLILIDLDQIGPIGFTTLRNDVIRPTANPAVYQGALVNLLGQPDDYDAYVDGCDGEDWVKASWGAFTAILTTRDGPMQLDGWEITDLGALDSRFRIGGGIRPTWRWSDFEAAGAGYDPSYGEFFYMFALNYNNGRFVAAQGATPSASAVIRGFGTGTGAFVSC